MFSATGSRRVRVGIAIAIPLIALPGCAPGTGVTEPEVSGTEATPSLTHVSVTPDSVSLEVSHSHRFTASGEWSDGSETSIPVTWRTTDPSGSVHDGVYSAGPTEGLFYVVATDPGTGLADTGRVALRRPDTPPPPPPPPNPPSTDRVVIWQAGMENGDLSEWAEPGGSNYGGGEFNSSGGDSWASQDVARGGGWSAKMVLSNGSGGTRLFRWREPGQNPEAFYSAWFYFPTRYEPDSWWNIFQFKSKVSESKNDPFWLLKVQNRGNGSMYVALGDWINNRSYEQDVVDLPIGSWVHIECYLRQSDSMDGRLTCWQDGQLLWDLDGITTHYPGASNQWSVNNYSSGVAPAPTIIYVDDASISVRGGS